MYADKEKKRENNRERQRRYREKHADEGVSTGVINTKMLCRCRYFVVRDNALVCQQCGKPPLEDKVRRGIITK
jgi:hypothetical protein